MSLSFHIDSKRKGTIILGEGSTQGLGDTSSKSKISY